VSAISSVRGRPGFLISVLGLRALSRHRVGVRETALLWL
jgi:hypothetical protein